MIKIPFQVSVGKTMKTVKVTKKMKLEVIRPQYNATGIYSVSDIERHHVGHWFDKSSMRFFKSKVCSDVFAGKTKVYFVSSEQFDATKPRLFTVRALDLKTRDIITIGEFQGYSTKLEAVNQALELAYKEVI